MRAVLGVNSDFPTKTKALLERETAEFEPAPIDKVDRAIRKRAPDERRNGVDRQPETRFVTPQRFVKNGELLRAVVQHPSEFGELIFAPDGDSMPEVAFRQRPGAGLLLGKLSLIHISEPTRLLSISYAVF